jgi:hypothetical protein
VSDVLLALLRERLDLFDGHFKRFDHAYSVSFLPDVTSLKRAPQSPA